MIHRGLVICVSILVCSAALLPAACSSAPKEKKKTILMTDFDDARLGAEVSESVAAQMGLLEDPALDAYVDEIGHKLLRGVPRRGFAYQFQIVDQFEPNAFALPGGYIYISRGLLALANDADELANVIGHEITHAARRHAAAQQAMSQRMNPLAFGYVGAATRAAYGRDMERDADRGGQMLAAAAGYDPMGMSTFMRSLGQTERLIVGHARNPSFLDTHPGSGERSAANAARARELRWQRDPALGDTRASYLRKIDGIPLGDRPQAGVFQGNAFLHPDLDFYVRFPDGWALQNTHTAVGASSPRGDAVVFLSADMPAGDPREMAEKFVQKTMEQISVKVVESKPVVIGRIDSWRMMLEGRGRGGSLTAYVTFIPYRGTTWRITGVSPSRSAKLYLGRTLNTARSFRPLTERERTSTHATFLRLATARQGESIQALTERTGNAWDAGHTAVYNGVFVDHRFDAGDVVKIARVVPYTPPAY